MSTYVVSQLADKPFSSVLQIIEVCSADVQHHLETTYIG